MINSIKSILDELDYKMNDEDRHFAEIFNENGYCIIPQSDLISDNIEKFRGIIDSLLKKESWRGGWEGKEEYMKYKKNFQIGATRLGNLFNKHELFLKLLTEKNKLEGELKLQAGVWAHISYNIAFYYENKKLINIKKL